MAYQSRETKLERNVKGKCRKYLMKSLVLKMFKLKGAHRSKRSKSNNNSGKPRTIVCKLLNYKLKEEILRDSKKLKGSNIFINENFCYETMQYRRNYGKKSKTYEVRAKLSILIIDQLLRCQIKAIQGK